MGGNRIVDHETPFDPHALPDATPTGAPASGWEDYFVMVHWDSVRLSAPNFYLNALLGRLKDNLTGDTCQRVSVLEQVTGYTAGTLNRKLRPGGDLTPFVGQRVKVEATVDEDGNVTEQVTRDHLWYSPSDPEPRWRLDYRQINLVPVEGQHHSNGRPVLRCATDADKWIKIPFLWLYEHPDTTAGNTWVRRRYYVEGKDPQTGETERVDVTAHALKGAATVAACATHEFKRGQAYGIAGLATVANESRSVMARQLAAAEDNGLIGVAHRHGRRKALRWVRLSESDPRSPEGRAKRSHGPTKEHNAAVMQERARRREAAKAGGFGAEAEAAAVEAARMAWLRGLPEDPDRQHGYAYADPDTASA